MEKRTNEHENDDIEMVDPEEGTETNLEDVEAAAHDTIKKLKKKLKECDAEKMKHLEELQRARADFLNSRKMLEEQLARDRERIAESHLMTLLPLADSFDMAMQDPAWELCDEKWRKGIEGIHAQLMNIFTQHDVTKINAVRGPFDPHLHDAVMEEPVDDDANVDTVLRVLQAGYTRHDTVLRHAKVIVGSKK